MGLPGRPKGATNKMTRDIKAAIESAFRQKNGKRNAYLLKLADEEPAIFCNLVAKCIPAAVAVSVSHHFDLGAAMLAAEETRRRLAGDTQLMIELNPDKPDTIEASKDKPLKVNKNKSDLP
jgi:hypothetical protein